MTREARQAGCPEAVLGWIPWYGEGSLSEDEEGAVAAHAAECAECRAEIDMIAGALFEIDADLPDPDVAFEALTARIAERARAGEEAEQGDEAFGLEESVVLDSTVSDVHVVEYESMDDLAQLAEWALEEGPSVAAGKDAAAGLDAPGARVIEGPWSRSSVWAAAAACVLVSLGALAGALYQGNAEIPGDPSYSLATAGSKNASAGLDATQPLFDVVFRENATVTEISSVLRGAGAQIVSGPSSLGVYRVRLSGQDRPALDGAADASAESLTPASAEAEFLTRLRNDGGGLAIFAEAVP